MTTEQRESLDECRLVAGGMAAVELAAVLQLVQIPALSGLLRAALWCFAASLPLLVTCLLVAGIDPSKKVVASASGWLVFAMLVALIGAVGLGFIFFHISLVAGLTYTGACILGIVLGFTRS